jgi:hypothetical protein
MIEAPARGGRTSAILRKDFKFNKDGHYYFSAWAKCDNVARDGHRWGGTGGRIGLHKAPFQGLVSKVQDTRDWFCYKPNGMGSDPVPNDWCVPAVTPRLCGEFRGWQEAARKQQSDIFKSGYVSDGVTISLNQIDLPYIDKSRPARIWIDDVMLFPQPMIIFDFDKALAKAGLTGDFVYSRPVTLGNEGGSPRVTPWQKIDKLTETAALGERKVLCLGIDLLKGGQGIDLQSMELSGPGGTIKPSEIEYQPMRHSGFQWENWEWWAHDMSGPFDYPNPCHVDFFIAYRIPSNAKPGLYRTSMTVKANGKIVAAVPVSIDVANFKLKPLKERFIGAIYNQGMGKDGGANMPPLNRDFLKFYGRSNFSYLMMFTRWLPWKGNGPEVDIDKLKDEMTFMRDEVGLTAGVGLYWDVSLDQYGLKANGLWKRCGQNRDQYRQEVIKVDKALTEASLPRLMYMIWDEPSNVDDKFGILKDTGAYTTCDAMGWPFFKSLEYISHTVCDDPSHEMGPAVYKYCRGKGVRYGMCGTAWSPESSRYQSGMMMAASGMSYWHQWHILNFYGVCRHCGKFVRNRSALNMGEGMIDLRYHDTLLDAIAYAEKKGTGKAEAKAAGEYLADVLTFCSGDLDGHVSYYNGTPTSWGDDRFYDQWRADMRKHIIAILSKTGPLPEGK